MDRMFATKSKVSKVKFCRSEPLEESDRISSLPDAAIHNIFSFLFSNDVVKTSMLAKRWRYLWASAPDIFLDDEAIPTSDRESGFVRFVDGLHRHHKAPEIKRYYLRLQQPNNSTFAESWVQFALARCVKRLFVNVVSHVPFRMPSCNSVRRMKLKLRGGDLVLPAAGGFTMLKYLALSEFRLAGNSVLDVNSDYCPLLRSFSLKNCSGLIGLRVDCPDLEDLCIRQCLDLDHLIVSGANIQTLSVEKSFTDRRPTSLVKITAPNLQTFTWLDRIIDNFSAGEFRSLRVAHVYLEIYYYEDTNNARRFFQYLASAENLQLQMRCFWTSTADLDLLERLVTSLYNLKKLTLLVGPAEYIFRGISHLSRCFCNLEVLRIHSSNDEIEEPLPNASAFYHKDWNYHMEPLNNLLEVNFCGFGGRPHEMEFVKYLLNYAVNLRKMTIVLAPNLFSNKRKKTQVTAKLLKLKRTSSQAILSFQTCMG